MSERALHLCLTSLALFEASLLSPNLFAPGFLLDTVEICDLFDQDSAHSRSPNFGSFFLSPPNFESGKGRGYFGFDRALTALLLAPELSRTLEYLGKPELASSTDAESSGSCLWQ